METKHAHVDVVDNTPLCDDLDPLRCWEQMEKSDTAHYFTRLLDGRLVCNTLTRRGLMLQSAKPTEGYYMVDHSAVVWYVSIGTDCVVDKHLAQAALKMESFSAEAQALLQRLTSCVQVGYMQQLQWELEEGETVLYVLPTVYQYTAVKRVHMSVMSYLHSDMIASACRMTPRNLLHLCNALLRTCSLMHSMQLVMGKISMSDVSVHRGSDTGGDMHFVVHNALYAQYNPHMFESNVMIDDTERRVWTRPNYSECAADDLFYIARAIASVAACDNPWFKLMFDITRKNHTRRCVNLSEAKNIGLIRRYVDDLNRALPTITDNYTAALVMVLRKLTLTPGEVMPDPLDVSAWIEWEMEKDRFDVDM